MAMVVVRGPGEGDLQVRWRELAARLLAAASPLSSFVAYREYAADDGEVIAIVELESLEECTRLRDQLAPRSAGDRVASDAEAALRVQVCELVRESRGTRTSGVFGLPEPPG